MPQPIILLVEDNPDDEALTKRAFTKNNIQCEVIVAHDGEEALAFLFVEGSRADRRPTLILLDLKLPKINGQQVLERIRSNNMTHNIPVIIMTSSREEQDIITSYSNGANSYIAKPVDYNEFVEIIRLLAKYWLEVNIRSPE